MQEKDGVAVPVVFDDALFAAEEGGEAEPGAAREDDPKNDARAPQFREVPFDGDFGKGSIIVRNHQGGNVGENGNEDDVLEVEGFIEDGDPETKEDFEVEGKRDTVDDVCVHSVEDLPAGLQGVNDGGETGCEEDNVGCGASGVRGTLDSDTGVSFLEGRSVVDTITCHGDEVTSLLEDLDDIILMVGENLCKTIGGLDEIIHF